MVASPAEPCQPELGHPELMEAGDAHCDSQRFTLSASTGAAQDRRNETIRTIDLVWPISMNVVVFLNAAYGQKMLAAPAAMIEFLICFQCHRRCNRRVAKVSKARPQVWYPR